MKYALPLLLLLVGCRVEGQFSSQPTAEPKEPAPMVLRTPDPLAPDSERLALLNDLLDQLGEQAPLSATVRVSVAELPVMGYCAWDEEDQVFDIVLHAGLTGNELADAIIHEWAHALVWDVPGAEEHGPEWGVAYARCYAISRGE